MASEDRPPSPTPSALPPVPSSPTYSYASTANPLSQYNLPPPPPPRPPHSVLSKSDLEASQTAYSDLLLTAKSYRLALASLSTAASTFGSALEACARLKEARSESLESMEGGGGMSNSFMSGGGRGKGACTADSLLAASGVHQLIANHQQILSETVYRSFEVPLLHELDEWRRRMEEEEMSYQKSAKTLSKDIRRMEKEGLRLHKQRKRDVGKFREHLVALTGKLDALTGLSGGHSRGLLREGQTMSTGIVECCAGLVRAEVDIFEALARKGWSGGGLDELLEKGRDLFANEEGGHDHPNHGAKIFSILPQNRSILAGPDTGEGTGVKSQRSDSLLVDGSNHYQSLAGAVSRDTDVNSLWSERGGNMNTSGILNRPRGVRPFSPTPGERVRDPLEDHVPPESSGMEIPKRGGKREGVDMGEESVRTVVPISPPEGSVEGEGHKDRDEAMIDDEESVSGVSERRERERERRWSVTDDDGVLSD